MKVKILNKEDSDYNAVNGIISQKVNDQLDTNEQSIVPEGEQVPSGKHM